jgi:hypothetical protein
MELLARGKTVHQSNIFAGRRKTPCILGRKLATTTSIAESAGCHFRKSFIHRQLRRQLSNVCYNPKTVMKLTATILALGFLAQSTVQAAPDAGSSCFETEQKLATAQRALGVCNDTAQVASVKGQRCLEELEQTADKLQSSAAKVETCGSSKDQQCQDAANFAATLLQGSTAPNACVPAATQAKLQSLLTSWQGLSKSLAQLDDYVSGSIDVLPRSAASTETERHLFRILGLKQRSPLWNRRLLVEAFRLTAPDAWRSLRQQGVGSIDAFFEARGPLPERYIAEAREQHAESPGPAGPPLTAALRMTLSYLQVADCDNQPESGSCGRARQLVELLDDTGPLIVRRRIDEMWSTPCDALNGDAVRAWLQDFPVSKNKEKQKTAADLTAAAKRKLFLCYLGDPAGDESFRNWVDTRLPVPAKLDSRTLPLVDDFRNFVGSGDALDRCGRAVRAMQRVQSVGCGVERLDSLANIAAWAKISPRSDAPVEEQSCQQIARTMWSGSGLKFPQSPAEQVEIDTERHTAMTALREACADRKGNGAVFENALASLTQIASDLGEAPVNSPWKLDANVGRPQEQVRFRDAGRYVRWLQSIANRESAADALSLGVIRGERCKELSTENTYDCELLSRLETRWLFFRRATLTGLALLVGIILFLWWASAFQRARRTFFSAIQTARQQLEALGFLTRTDPWRLAFPSRHDTLRLALPSGGTWERWGTEACAVVCAPNSGVRESDVNHAAEVALREEMRVAFLLHPDAAAPELGAVRATLDWAARGGAKAVQVLLLPMSRLAWATRDEDLLDLVESTSLRGNPFEVRGPVRSSSQFWNRERLVAGLLTESRSGNWVVVTGLRRFGKSSLALEVARRTPGPAAYVDLAGFHHEVSHGETPAVAVEAILRTLVTRLADSTSTRFPAASIPPIPSGSLDAPTLATWMRALSSACATSSGSQPPPMLLVLDEVEQLLTTKPEQLERALDVMATLTGRLRSALSEPSSPHAGGTVGVVLCAALHPLLWVPLSTLGGQSLMGAFPSICVPALDDEAAQSMMRGLGARQGIRFEEQALCALIAASQGVPLLLRRLGTSVLELYDGDRARHGALGAVRIGIEGVNEAIMREQRDGSPLRVWVESEIAQSDSPAGLALRALAQRPQVATAELQSLLQRQVSERFLASGLSAHLSAAELDRRAHEAAAVMIRLLAQSKLLEAHGDLTAPGAYSLPDGIVRQILSAHRVTL